MVFLLAMSFARFADRGEFTRTFIMPWNKRTTRKDRKRRRRQRAREAINGYRAYVAILDEVCREAAVHWPSRSVIQWEDDPPTPSPMSAQELDDFYAMVRDSLEPKTP